MILQLRGVRSAGNIEERDWQTMDGFIKEAPFELLLLQRVVPQHEKGRKTDYRQNKSVEYNTAYRVENKDC